jgi:hypothetical protein
MTSEEALVNIPRLIDGSQEVDDAKALQAFVQASRRWPRAASVGPSSPANRGRQMGVKKV